MTHGTHDYEDDPRNADIQININGELFHRNKATVSVFDSGYILRDGVWAEHWYQAVERSTGFEPYRSRQFNLSESETEIAYASMPAYEALKASPTLIT